ncbi:MAG: hypothetical protein R6U28_00065 [Cyclonatronaceae bacterium]
MIVPTIDSATPKLPAVLAASSSRFRVMRYTGHSDSCPAVSGFRASTCSASWIARASLRVMALIFASGDEPPAVSTFSRTSPNRRCSGPELTSIAWIRSRGTYRFLRTSRPCSIRSSSSSTRQVNRSQLMIPVTSSTDSISERPHQVNRGELPPWPRKKIRMMGTMSSRSVWNTNVSVATGCWRRGRLIGKLS